MAKRGNGEQPTDDSKLIIRKPRSEGQILAQKRRAGAKAAKLNPQPLIFPERRYLPRAY